jgi:hypothetical protein
MLKKLALAGALVCFGGVTTLACPRGDAYPDGCADASTAATVERPNFFNGYAGQSGQTLAYRPPWNVAGVDYPVGNITPITSMQDPAVVYKATSSDGCTYYPAGANKSGLNYTYGPELYCDGNTSLNITQINFGPVGEHGSTILAVAHTYAGAINIHDNYFQCDPGLNSAQATISIGTIYFMNPNHATTKIYDNQFNGEWQGACFGANVNNRGGVVAVNYLGYGNVSIMYNAGFDANGHYYDYRNEQTTLTNPLSTIAGSNVVKVVWSGHTLSVGDTVVLAAPSSSSSWTAGISVGGLRIGGVYAVRSVGTGGAFTINAATAATSTVSRGGGSVKASSGTFFVAYNYLEGSENRCPIGHGEFTFSDGGIPSQSYLYNTILQTNASASCFATVIYPMGGLTADIYGDVTLNGNTIVAGNLLGGAQYPFSVFSAAVGNGGGTGPGNILTVTSAPVVYNSNSGIITTTPAGGPYIGSQIGSDAIVIYGHVPGSSPSGVGSRWYVDCANAVGACPGIEFNPSIQTTIPAAQGNIWTSTFSYNQAATFNHGGVYHVTLTNNYVNWTNAPQFDVWQFNMDPEGTDGAYNACVNGSVVGGNIDMVSGAALNKGSSAYRVVRGPGC